MKEATPYGNVHMGISIRAIPNGNVHMGISIWAIPNGNVHMGNSIWAIPNGNVHMGNSIMTLMTLFVLIINLALNHYIARERDNLEAQRLRYSLNTIFADTPHAEFFRLQTDSFILSKQIKKNDFQNVQYFTLQHPDLWKYLAFDMTSH